ncbi:16428_t:CDS:10 [Funneliformis caledonium]|uniref:16428_t:CDS:1 n=1 Tax=Funneliformis caledonium TaxID=1117310 RepID=A0A9N9DWD2_9GLOM|nr:16428_t:CDS:10 [Funneliformis caledonium]
MFEFLSKLLERARPKTLVLLRIKRFLQEAKELDSDSNSIIEKQNVIIERLQLQVQSTYNKETLLTFDESNQNTNSTYLCDKHAFDVTFDSNLISLERAKKIKTISKDESTEYDLESEESDEEVIDKVQSNEEIKSLKQDEVNICEKLNTILREQKEKEMKSGKTIITSTTLNNIINISDKEINKSFINGRFDSYYYKDHDVAQQVLTHCSVRLEASILYESEYFKLEQTFAIDMTIYIINRLFHMNEDLLDIEW